MILTAQISLDEPTEAPKSSEKAAENKQKRARITSDKKAIQPKETFVTLFTEPEILVEKEKEVIVEEKKLLQNLLKRRWQNSKKRITRKKLLKKQIKI